MKNIVCLLIASVILGGCQSGITFGEIEQRLGAEQLCAAIINAKPSIAAAPIARTLKRHASIWDTLEAYFGFKDEPFRDVPPMSIFEALPKISGPVTSCRPGNLSMVGTEVIKEIYIEYPHSRLTVTLIYLLSSSPRLKSFKVNAPEPLLPGQELPDAQAQRIAAFVDQLDRMEKGLPPRQDQTAVDNSAHRPIATDFRFSSESSSAYARWLALEKKLITELDSNRASQWPLVEKDAASVAAEIGLLLAHLNEDARKSRSPGRADYVVQAMSYAQSLDNCTASLLKIARGMRSNAARPNSYPEAALIVDMEHYKTLKLELQKQAFALRRTDAK